ncbi:MAG: VWA domain-containing protein [Chloroflexota bacterium]|nr:VWA domain-containing protein [Chloroflexota bacterium]MDE2958641.1 VWA domain-containing protein [Chloroflexota bacterium]
MVTYHISYGEPQRGFDYRKLLVVLGILLALIILAAIAYGIYWLVANSDGIDVPDFAASEEIPQGTPLNEVLASLYFGNTNTVFLVDVSRSIEDGGNLPVVKKALLDVVLPYVNEGEGPAAQNSRAALMTFTDQSEPLVPMATFEESGESVAAWLTAVNEMGTQDRPAYIYDAMEEAHALLAEQDPEERDRRLNVIVLLTDGSDGGFKVIDPAGATVCPPGAGAAEGEVCTVQTAADGTPTYTTFNPAALTACPPQLQVAEGMGCVESSSATGEGELVYLLNSSDGVPNLMVHTIGFGREADQALLQLLAKAGEHEGRYVYADH